MASSGDNISVAVRIRPAKHKKDVNEWLVQDQIIYAAQPYGKSNVFAFDHIFPQEKTNADVYEKVVQPIIASVMAGYHGTVFAYGQTSSGKTHTMMGNDQDPGIIRRAIAQIFNAIHEQSDREFLIRISYLEIYNEQIRDLLNNSSSANLQIKGPDMAVAGLTEQVTTDSEQILRFMMEGNRNRRVAFTNMNERSSRSHSIFRITIESSNRDSETNTREGVRTSQLNLVDLAGCERTTQSGASASRLREGCHINTSLTVLGLVIRKLSNGERHINFRDSKLTRILQNSLGGNSRTAIICNISPSNYETSLSTLRFGSDAKRIKNKPVINQVIGDDASLLQKRNKEIESLKALIARVETGKEQQLKEKDDAIDELRKKIDSLQKLAIGGNRPSTASGPDVDPMPVGRDDTRRRATWCPGRMAALSNPVIAPQIDELTNVPRIPSIPQTHEGSPSSTPSVMPRKRKSEEAQKRIASLEAELESVRKRARIQSPRCETTPASMDIEGKWWWDDDSPFAAKLKIMATPVQEILGMRLENSTLKRRLAAASGSCSTTAASEDVVQPLRNGSLPSTSEPKPETCDAACQFEELNVPLEREPVPQAKPRTRRAIRRSASTPAVSSETSTMDVEESWGTLPRNVRDVGVRFAFLQDLPNMSQRTTEALTEFLTESKDAELRKGILKTRTEGSLIRSRLSSLLFSEVEQADAEVQTESDAHTVEPQRVDCGVQVSVESSCGATQVHVDMTDANTSISSGQFEHLSTQTADEEMNAIDTARASDPRSVEISEPSSRRVTTRDVGVMAQIEELWIIKMRLDQERTAREEAESKLEEVRNESAKLNRTIERFLEYFAKHGIDAREVSSGQIALNPETVVAESEARTTMRRRPSSRRISFLQAEEMKGRRSM